MTDMKIRTNVRWNMEIPPIQNHAKNLPVFKNFQKLGKCPILLKFLAIIH